MVNKTEGIEKAYDRKVENPTETESGLVAAFTTFQNARFHKVTRNYFAGGIEAALSVTGEVESLEEMRYALQGYLNAVQR